MHIAGSVDKKPVLAFFDGSGTAHRTVLGLIARDKESAGNRRELFKDENKPGPNDSKAVLYN